MKYKFKILSRGHSFGSIEAILESEDAMGWEVVSYQKDTDGQNIFLLKRKEK